MRRSALVLVAVLLLASCGGTANGKRAPGPPSERSLTGTPPPNHPHVAAVTLVCRYVTLDGDSRVTREGEGEFCTPATPHTVGSVQVLRVFDVRALLTIRSPDRSDYLVESADTSIRVGDPWPPPGR